MPRAFHNRKNTLSIVAEDSAFRADRRALDAELSRALAILHVEGVALAVFLLRDQSMARLNRAFRHKEGATTVLSFAHKGDVPHPEIERKYRYLGEVYLAPRVIRAKGETALRMVVHGLLHLLGYAHKKKNDRIAMEAREAEVLTELERRPSPRRRRTTHGYATHHRRT